MKRETEFLIAWLTAYAVFYELTDVYVWGWEQGREGDHTRLSFYTAGRRSCQTIKGDFPFARIDYACVLRAVIEAAERCGFRHHVTDDAINQAVGQKSPLERLKELS